MGVQRWRERDGGAVLERETSAVFLFSLLLLFAVFSLLSSLCLSFFVSSVYKTSLSSLRFFSPFFSSTVPLFLQISSVFFFLSFFAGFSPLLQISVVHGGLL